MKKLLLLIVISLSISDFLQAQSCATSVGWTTMTSIPGATVGTGITNYNTNPTSIRYSSFSFSIGNKGYIGGGMYPIRDQYANVGTYYRSDFWEYDPFTNVWTQKQDILNTNYTTDVSNTNSSTKNNGGIIEARGFSVGGKGYFIGGRTKNNIGAQEYSGFFQEYDPVNNTWTSRANALSSACDLIYCKAATFTINGVAYVGSAQGSSSYANGCYNNNNAVSTVSRKWYRFDQNTMSFSSIQDYPGSVQINPVGFGGKDKGFLIEYNELWRYDPSNNSWTNTNQYYPNNIHTNNQAAFTIGDYAYIGGGFIETTPYKNYGSANFYEFNMNTERYSGSSGTGNTGATTWNFPWSSGLSEIAAFNIGNKGYFYGGVSGANNSYQVSGALYEFTPPNSQHVIETYLNGNLRNPNYTTSLCRGSTLSVQAYDPCASYPSENVFTAQLSDANGFFSNASPTVIGTSTASWSYYQSFSVTIPTGIPLGSRYRIRVVASSPYTIGSDNGSNLTISDPGSAGTISHPYSVPYPSELASDTIKSVTLPDNTVSSYSWKKSADGVNNWTDITGANQSSYILPGTDQADVYYRRYATLGCNATIYTDPQKLRVYSTSNTRLNGIIKGKVKTAGGSGVPGITVTVQKTIALKGSPITKTYTATTNESGDYTVSGIFYGDEGNGDPTSVRFNITASKAGHVFKSPNPRTADLSITNYQAIGIDFTDESTLTISGSIQQTCSDCEVNFRSVDSLNDVKLSTSKNNLNFSTTSGADGYGRYSFALTETGDYIITPSKTGHKFNPVQRTVVMGSDNIGLIDFVDTTKYTISGALRAGGNQIIGSAQLEFTDTVPGRAVKFKKIVTTAADGSFSVKLPARTYKMKLLGFTPSGLGVDVGVNDLLTWFNTTFKDSSYINIDSSNQIFNLIYHRPPVLVVDNLPDTSCGNYVVFKQDESKAFTVKIYEGAVSHNVLLGYDTVSAVKLNTAVHIAGIQPQQLNYKHVKGLAQVELTGGSPNRFDNYYKPFKVNYEDKYGRKATELSRNAIVFGVDADPGTFTTVSPSVPVLILHAPPGDQSTSFWEQTQTTETAMRFSALTDKTTGTFQDVKIGTSFSAGIGFVVETSIWANANQSMSNSQRVNKATEAILSSSTTVGYATEPNGGDVYVGGAMNLCYSVAHELKYMAGCQLGVQNSLAVAPKGFATTFTYSESFLKETLIPSLQFIADSNPDSSSKYINQIKVWEQVIANNNINKARAEFVRNRSFDGNAGPITESTTNTATQSSSIEFEVEIQKDKAISAGIEIGGAGYEGGASVSLKMTTGSSSTNTNTSSTTMGYTLDDDDAGDYYSVDIKKDPVYNTPVFVLVAGTSSCPAEPIAQSRDYAQLSIPTPEIRNIPSNGEALFQLKLQNASQSRESRTYFLTFNQSSNPNGALVSIGGSPVTSNIAYTIPYMGSQLVTVSVKKNASSNVFSYEGLEFTLSDACDGGVATSNTISAHFQSPCSDLILNAPGNNWVAKSSNNNSMPVEFAGYNLSNLQSVALEYAHAGRGDWVTDTTIFQNFISNPTSTVLNWNIAGIEDGAYDIRMKLNCVSGSGYTQRLSGIIDREAPSLFGLPQPTDRNYVSGDEISMSYTENIQTNNLNSNKVTMTRMLDGSPIPVQVSGYNNKLMVVPLLDLSTFAAGEAIRLVSKNIADIYGNESAVADTFLFNIGATVATNANRRVYVSNVNPAKSAVIENAGDSLQIKFTISNSSAYNTMVNFIVGGSAAFESDYGVSFSSRQNLTTQFNGTQGTINIPPNTTSAILKIKPIGDDQLEANESVIIRLLSGGDYKIGTDRFGKDSAIVVADTIKNDDLHQPEIALGDIPRIYPIDYCASITDSSLAKPYVWNVPETLPIGYCETAINAALVRPFMEIKLPTTLPTGYCWATNPYQYFEKIYSFSFGTMSNSQIGKTECTNGYTDYTASVLAPTLRVGEAVPFSVLSAECNTNPWGTSPSGLSIFIDYNRDGDFDDAGEKAFTTNGTSLSPNNRSGFVTIPTDASLGLTKMRVVVSEWESSPNSCYYAYGEVEDYSVMIYGNKTDSATLPKGYCQTVVDTNLVRPIIINVPTTIPEGYCDMVMDSTKTRLNKLPSGYCTSTPLYNDNEQIFGVSFGTMNNPQTENCSTGYTDYTSTIAAPIVHLGESVPFSVKTDLCTPNGYAWSGMAIYIDYNRDGDFNDAGEMTFNNYQALSAPNTRTNNVIIPATATLGLTRMRVIVTGYDYATNPCQDFSYGEVEDYAVMIAAASTTALPTGYCAANASAMGDEQIFAVGFGTMNNTQAENCTTGYTDYSSTIAAPVVHLGESIPFSVKTDECDGPTYYPSGLSIFIDYNRDGDFNDANEKAYTSNGTAYSPNTRSGNILIPADAMPGLTKMRVVISEGNGSPGSCGEFGYGEVEDYAVKIEGASNTGLPTGYCAAASTDHNFDQILGVSLGTMNNDEEGIDDFSKGYTDYSSSVAAPVVRQGQTVPFTVKKGIINGASNYQSGTSVYIDYNRDGDFDDAGERAYTTNGTTSSIGTLSGDIIIPATATPGLTKMRVVVSNWYWVPISCGTNLGNGEVEDYAVMIEPPAGPTIFDDEQIVAVSFGSMNNVQSDNASTNYTNFASSISAPIIRRGQTVPFSVSTDEVDKAPYYGSGMSIFIDYNRDGDFNDEGEKAYTTTQTTVSPNTRSGGIQIPANAALGLTKMRIVVADGDVSPNSCGNFNYGEVEDYLVMIFDTIKIQSVFEDEQISAVSFGTMNNVQAENSSTNYSDYSLLVKAPTVLLGQSIPFSVSTAEQDGAPYYASGMSIFIDYNRDGDFDDDGEKAYTTNGITVSPNTRSGEIFIPSTATAGLTKMRVVVQDSVASPGSCITLGYGEVEDYSVIISPVPSIFNEEQIASVSFGTMNNVQSENCGTNYTDYSSTVTAPIVTTGTAVPFSVATDECDHAPYYASGMSIFIDYNRDGDFDDEGEKAYTTNGLTVSPNTRSGNINIPSNATLGLTKMRVVVQDSVASPGACITLGYGEVEDYAIMIHNVPPVQTVLDDEQIKAVSFGTMNNAPSDNCGSNYSDYSTSVIAPTVALGQSVPFSVLTDECDHAPYYASGMSIFIDYNRDGDFDDAGEKAYTTNSTTLSPNTRSGNIVIPSTATQGLTKMRVVVAEGVASPDACIAMGYGDVEDYGVMIMDGAPATICQGGTGILSGPIAVDGVPVYSYVWKLGNNIVGTSRNISINAPGTYALKVYTANGFSGASIPYVVTATTPPTSDVYAAVCPSQLPYNWNGTNYSTTGNYSKTISNANGCDSIAYLHLIVKSNSYSVETIEAIDTYEWHGVVYDASTKTPTWTGTNAAGCDSIVTLHLTIIPICVPVEKVFDIIACNTYSWHGIKFTNSVNGMEWTTLNYRGCDSTEILNLTIKRSTTSTATISICPSQLPYVWNSTICSAAGTYTKRLNNADGCDSIAKLVLTVKSSTNSVIRMAVCANEMPYIWNGTTYATAGTYVQSFTNWAGCDSTATLLLTVKPVSNSNTNLSICSSQLPFTWNGLTLTASGAYSASFNNAYGCDSLAILNLKVNQVSNVVETISTSSETYTWHGTTYTSSNHSAIWIGSNVAGCDSIVTLDLSMTNECVPTEKVFSYTACNAYIWHGIRATASTTLEWVGVNAGGCDSVEILNLTITNLSPTASPASITQTLVSNVCGARVYRYTAAAVTNATGYSWTLPVAAGGIKGVFVDSGDVTNSKVLLVRYASTMAAFTTDSVKVKALSPCGSAGYRAAKLINTQYTVPNAPTAITIAPISTTVCGAKRYRFTAPNLPAATSVTVAATGYLWAFTGVLGATIDSGEVYSKVITVTFSNNAAAAKGDSVKLRYTADCGNSLFKASKLMNTLLSVPAAPTVTVTAVQTNICGARKYKYAASALPLATITAGAASGWFWSLPAEGAVGSTGKIDSGTINSQVIIVSYTSNAAASAGDSIRVRFTSACGWGAVKATKLTNTALAEPLAPASITTTLVSDFCGTKIYRYTTPVMPLATTTAGAAKGYWWSTSGPLGTTASLDSGTLSGRTIKLMYTSNAAAGVGDSIKVLYTSDCRNSSFKAMKLSNAATPFTSLLAAPSTLTGTTSICPFVGTNESARYVATAVTGAVSYTWTLPIGAVVDSGSNGLKIKVRFITAGASDSIYVQAVGNNGCLGAKKVLKLTTVGCQTSGYTRVNNPIASSQIVAEEPMSISVYPNPASSAFKLAVKSRSLAQMVNMRVLDVNGRVIKTMKFTSDKIISFGNELRAGVYFVEVKDGDVIKTVKVIKF